MTEAAWVVLGGVLLKIAEWLFGKRQDVKIAADTALWQRMTERIGALEQEVSELREEVNNLRPSADLACDVQHCARRRRPRERVER